MEKVNTLTLDIEQPKDFPGLNKLLLSGAQITPVQRLDTFSPEQFEIFIQEWAFEYLKKQYNEVQRRGGSGDKGRDIVAWIDPKGTGDRRWDCYQCKHYNEPLTPSSFWIELGKLCHYIFSKEYTRPTKYFIASNKGIGNSLQDYIDNPEKINSQLISNWAKHCETKINANQKIILQGDFLDFIMNFDFSLLESLSPSLLLEQHSQTKYHAMIFGSELKPRPKPTTPPFEIANLESRYIEQMYEAISDRLNIPVKTIKEFCTYDDILKFFNYSRECFYCAESLKEFARDNLPDETYFSDLMEQIFEGIQISILREYPTGYNRMLETINHSTEISLTSNILVSCLRPADRIGLCHHLANENRIMWVMK